SNFLDWVSFIYICNGRLFISVFNKCSLSLVFCSFCTKSVMSCTIPMSPTYSPFLYNGFPETFTHFSLPLAVMICNFSFQGVFFWLAEYIDIALLFWL